MIAQKVKKNFRNFYPHIFMLKCQTIPFVASVFVGCWMKFRYYSLIKRYQQIRF